MKTKLQTKAASVEAFLKQELTHASNQEHLREIMEYAVTNGGKRLRPILLLASYELFEEDSTKAVPYAAALEMIHSYSLVHDDLPAMDNDDLRRGKPTCHKQFSEFGAILAGDALLNLSFETMLRYAGNFPAETALRGMTYIANASGAKGMCAGQMSDMEQSATDFQSIAQMHRNKTGALLKASVVAGAILGGAEEKVISLLEEYADLIGLIFQIKDDVLDVESDEATLGKPVHSDQKNQKITFVSEYGLERCRCLMAEYEAAALAKLSVAEDLIGKKNVCDFLRELTSYMAKRTN